MALYMTSDTLIASIKRRGQIPTSQNTFQDEDFLAIANEELMLSLVPHVMSYHEDYFLYSESVALTANESRYEIPHRAIGNKLYDVQYMDTSGNTFEMTRIQKANFMDYQRIGNASISSNLYTYYIESNEVVVVPSIGDNVVGSIVFVYFFRPNALVKANRVATITAINTSTGVVTISTKPTHFSTAITYDFLQLRSPHKTLSYSITALSVSATSVTFAVNDLPSKLEVGDMLAQSEECLIPQIPTELHVLLVQRVVERIAESIGDQALAASSKAKILEFESKSGTLIDDRVDSSPQKIRPRHGFLNKRGISRRR